MGKYAQDICRHRFRWIFAQFGWQAQINTRHKYKTLNHAPVYILQFANLGGLKQVTSDVDLLHKSIWLILLMSMDWPTDCQLKCQISIWAMLPRDRHQVGRFRFGSWYLCCLFFLLHRCTNTQMAVDDNLIGFSSLTLPTTSTDKANLVQFFALGPTFHVMMTIIIKYFITYSIIITDKASHSIHSIYGTIFLQRVLIFMPIWCS